MMCWTLNPAGRLRHTRGMKRLLFIFLSLAALSAVPAATEVDPPRPGPVYVIPIQGMIESAHVYVVRRGDDVAAAGEVDGVGDHSGHGHSGRTT